MKSQASHGPADTAAVRDPTDLDIVEERLVRRVWFFVYAANTTVAPKQSPAWVHGDLDENECTPCFAECRDGFIQAIDLLLFVQSKCGEFVFHHVSLLLRLWSLGVIVKYHTFG